MQVSKNILVQVVLAPGEKHELPPVLLRTKSGSVATTRFGFVQPQTRLSQAQLKAWHDTHEWPGVQERDMWRPTESVFWSKPLRVGGAG